MGDGGGQIDGQIIVQVMYAEKNNHSNDGGIQDVPHTIPGIERLLGLDEKEGRERELRHSPFLKDG